jgi:aspartyl-tRNA(Asn)/glutamyl-tRNA(Gln) amidotransferase subunit A
MDQPLHWASATQLSTALTERTVTASALAEQLLDRVQVVDPQVGAFLGIDQPDVMEQAAASDRRHAAGATLGPLDGVPVAIKNAIAVAGQPLTCASRMLHNFVSPYDATVIAKLRAAGAVLFGRLNMDEFAMGSSTENSAIQLTRNPWNLLHAPGGSSGGSAAALASGTCPLALGSDTGGSIRQPAAFCGVVGLKPSYGRVSRYGLVAFASSLDQIGPMARTVADTALLLDAISGPDPRDATSWPEPAPACCAALRTAAPPRRIGLPTEYFGDGMDPEVRAAIDTAIEHYRAAGCTFHAISLPHSDLAVPVYYIVATAEASANLARYDGVRYGHRTASPADMFELHARSRGEGFGPEVKRRIMLGTYVLSSGYYDAWYGRAQKVRTLIQRDFLTAFNQVDAILAPTTPTPAFRLGEKIDDPLAMYLADIYTISANLAGLPALSVPCGFSSGGLPIGLQLIGKPFDEASLLQLAHSYEQAHTWHLRRPPLNT